jgi:hypothetical protein
MNTLNGHGKRTRILVRFILIRLISGEIVFICIYIRVVYCIIILSMVSSPIMWIWYWLYMVLYIDKVVRSQLFYYIVYIYIYICNVYLDYFYGDCSPVRYLEVNKEMKMVLDFSDTLCSINQSVFVSHVNNLEIETFCLSMFKFPLA